MILNLNQKAHTGEVELTICELPPIIIIVTEKWLYQSDIAWHMMGI